MRRLVAVLLLLLSVMVVAAAEGGAFTATIVGGNADRVHLRAEPSQAADSLGLYFEGTPVRCTGSLDETWVPVQIGQARGYMMSAYLSDQFAETCSLNEMKRGVVRTDVWAELHAEPSPDSTVLTGLQEGAELIVMGETSSHWYYVSADGLAGYVRAECVDLQLEPYVREPVTANVWEVLAGQGMFWHNETQEYMYLSQVGEKCHDGADVHFPRFAVANVDQDSNDEIILEMTVDANPYYGYLVLKSADGTVWGYERWYRSMLNLKADGTFSFSSGAHDNGFGYLKPQGNQCDNVDLAACESENDEVRYYVKGAEVAEAVWRSTEDCQDQKPDVVWYVLTPEAILRNPE